MFNVIVHFGEVFTGVGRCFKVEMGQFKIRIFASLNNRIARPSREIATNPGSRAKKPSFISIASRILKS